MLNEYVDEGAERVNACMCVTAGQQNFPLTEKLFFWLFLCVSRADVYSDSKNVRLQEIDRPTTCKKKKPRNNSGQHAWHQSSDFSSKIRPEMWRKRMGWK